MTGKELAKTMADFYRENPTAWTRLSFARLKNGEKTGSLDPFAVSWCVSGLVSKVSQDGREAADLSGLIYSKIRKDCYFSSIPQWNDSRGSVEEVIQLLDEAAS